MKKIILMSMLFFAAMIMNTAFADNNVVNNGGWVDVPLTDTQPFDMNCEYRIYRDDGPGVTHKDFIYPYAIKPDLLMFDIANEGQPFYQVDAVNKTIVYNPNTGTRSAVSTIIQKRCSLPDTTPTGIIAVFDGMTCPDGWTLWPFGKASVECNTSNCHLIICKKN